MKRGSWSAGTVRVVISRFTDARRPTARRLRTPTTARTTTTSADVRNIFEASRMVLSLFARASISRRGRRSQLSCRELGDEPPLIVDDLGLGCQGPPIRVSDKVDR